MPKANYISAIVVVAALALAAATNPSPDRHRIKIKEAVAERSPVAGMLGVGSLTAFMSNYHSVGVASYTIANERIISIGIYGMVFVL